MLKKITYLFIAFYPVLCSTQSVVIDIKYQPYTIYQWTRSIVNDGSVEYLGAEDMGDWLDIMGVDAYNESKTTEFISVRMQTTEWNHQKIPFSLSIDSLSKEVISTSDRTLSNQNADPLEYSDLEILGVINHYQKIEIDSIYGVDSLREKNRVFKLLDDIHRSWIYPKDTLMLGRPLEKTNDYNASRSDGSDGRMRSTYTLESIDNGIARVKLDFLVYTDGENTTDEIMDSRLYDGKGTGLILFDIEQKQVLLHEYTVNVTQTINVAEIAVEAVSSTSYSWRMKVLD